MKEQQRQEIDKLYLTMYSRLYEYARSVLPNDALAEEAVQDTFTIACNKPEALLNSPNPTGWLVITLKHVLSNTLRKQQLTQRILADHFASSELDAISSHDHLNLDILYDDIAQTDDFKLLKEMALEGKSYQQMAEARGISQATCRKRVQRARQKLQKKMNV